MCLVVTVFVACPPLGGCSTEECGVPVFDEQRVTGSLTFPATRYQAERKEESFDEPFELTTPGGFGSHEMTFTISHPPPIKMRLRMDYLPYSYSPDLSALDVEMCVGQNACQPVDTVAKVITNPTTDCGGPDNHYVNGPCPESFEFGLDLDGEYFKGTVNFRQKSHVEGKSCEE
jgi:hypothetical protein